MSRLYTTALFFLLAATSAHAVTIDFEDGDRSLIRNSQDPAACIADVTVQTQGFTFQNAGDCSAYFEFLVDGESNLGLYFASAPGESEALLTMTHDNGTHFDLFDFDALLGASQWSYVYGYRDNVQVFSEFVTIDQGFVENQTLNWTNVDRVEFYKNSSAPNSFGIDNLNVNVVPIPAAVWLLASALGLLGWRRSTN